MQKATLYSTHKEAVEAAAYDAEFRVIIDRGEQYTDADINAYAPRYCVIRCIGINREFYLVSFDDKDYL